MDWEKKIENVILALETGEFHEVGAAARKYQMHCNTLTRWQDGETTCHKAHSNQQVLNKGKAEALVAHIQRYSNQGFPIRDLML